MGAGIPLKIPGVLDLYAEHQGRGVSAACDGRDGGRRYDDALRSGGLCGGCAWSAAPAEVPGDRVVEYAGDHDGEEGEWPRGWVGDRDADCGRTQCSSARQAAADGSASRSMGIGMRSTFEKLNELGVPFWLAGGYGHPDKLREALALGAAGVQVGTAFAFSDESGLRDDYKQELLDKVWRDGERVYRPAGVADGVPVQGGAVGGNGLRGGGV